MASQFTKHHSQSGSLQVSLWQGRNLQPEELLRSKAARHPFFRQCDVVFPVPQGCADPLQLFDNAWASKQPDMTYYHAQGPLQDLLALSWVQKGHCCAVALNTPSDQCNTFAVLPGGTLVYTLDRETFQTCGLPAEAVQPGAAAKVGRPGGSKPAHYCGTIDMSVPSFKAGKPLYERLQLCLRNSSSALTMLVCALPGASAAAVSAAPEFPASYTMRAVPLTLSCRTFSSVCCPVLESSNFSSATAAAESSSSANVQLPARARCELLCDLFEWLGAAACGLESVLQRAPLDQYVTEFRTPAHLPYRSGSTVCRLRLSGLITQEVSL
jgi:Ribonuclease P 40kDa (Rpp40) subunit